MTKPALALTELEAVTLGWVRSHEPATPYAVRTHCERSPSARFSGSAGAIYPLMRRLEKQGLLRSEAVSTGKRRGRAYRVTREGRRALKVWLQGPLEPRAMFSFDPFRTRMIYLGQLTPRERQRWLDDAEQCLHEQLRLVADYETEAGDDPFHRLANDNARRDIRARLAWLRAARAKLEA